MRVIQGNNEIRRSNRAGVVCEHYDNRRQFLPSMPSSPYASIMFLAL